MDSLGPVSRVWFPDFTLWNGYMTVSERKVLLTKSHGLNPPALVGLILMGTIPVDFLREVHDEGQYDK